MQGQEMNGIEMRNVKDTKNKQKESLKVKKKSQPHFNAILRVQIQTNT